MLCCDDINKLSKVKDHNLIFLNESWKKEWWSHDCFRTVGESRSICHQLWSWSALNILVVCLSTNTLNLALVELNRCINAGNALNGAEQGYSMTRVGNLSSMWSCSSLISDRSVFPWHVPVLKDVPSQILTSGPWVYRTQKGRSCGKSIMFTITVTELVWRGKTTPLVLFSIQFSTRDQVSVHFAEHYIIA